MTNTRIVRRSMAVAAALLAIAALYLASRYSYPLFHSVVEMFSIIILCGTFMVAWNSRRFLDSNYLLFICISYLFVAIVELLHTLAYKGMGVFPGADANLPTQLWIATRYLQASSLLVAPVFFRRRVPLALTMTILGLVTAALLAAIFTGVFPDCYVEGVGLTSFKVISEYVITAMFAAAVLLLYLNRHEFDKGVARLLIAALALAGVAELMFTRYMGVYDLSNQIGHHINLIASYLMYSAIIETGLVRPYNLLFRNLTLARDDLEQRVLERTSELFAAGERLRILHDIDRAILAARSPEHIAQVVSHALRQAMPCRQAGVILFYEEDQEARILALDSDSATTVTVGTPIPDPVYRLMLSGQAGTSSTEALLAVPAQSNVIRQLLDEGLTRYIALPLAGKGQAIGCFTLWTDSAAGFDADQLSFAGQAADSLAVAIENARLLAALQTSREQLQRLSHRLVQVQEEERRSIARELHDQAGQALTAIKLGLGLIERSTGQPEVVADRVRDLKDATDGIMQELHDLAVRLRPASLDRLGLRPALESFLDEFSRQCPVRVRLEAVGLGDSRLNPETETTLYRVVQEALTNVARHAKAKNVGVILERRGGCAVAIVEDDGSGFDVAEAMQRGRLGILGMRERAEGMGGKLTIESAPGAGTTVFVEVPAP